MSFEVTLQQAKQGNTQAILEIVEMYKPLIIRNAIVEGFFDEDLYQEAIVEGFFDEDLYQELIRVVLSCIKRFELLD